MDLINDESQLAAPIEQPVPSEEQESWAKKSWNTLGVTAAAIEKSRYQVLDNAATFADAFNPLISEDEELSRLSQRTQSAQTRYRDLDAQLKEEGHYNFFTKGLVAAGGQAADLITSLSAGVTGALIEAPQGATLGALITAPAAPETAGLATAAGAAVGGTVAGASGFMKGMASYSYVQAFSDLYARARLNEKDAVKLPDGSIEYHPMSRRDAIHAAALGAVPYAALEMFENKSGLKLASASSEMVQQWMRNKGFQKAVADNVVKILAAQGVEVSAEVIGEAGQEAIGQAMEDFADYYSDQKLSASLADTATNNFNAILQSGIDAIVPSFLIGGVYAGGGAVVGKVTPQVEKYMKHVEQKFQERDLENQVRVTADGKTVISIGISKDQTEFLELDTPMTRQQELEQTFSQLPVEPEAPKAQAPVETVTPEHPVKPGTPRSETPLDVLYRDRSPGNFEVDFAHDLAGVPNPIVDKTGDKINATPLPEVKQEIALEDAELVTATKARNEQLTKVRQARKHAEVVLARGVAGKVQERYQQKVTALKTAETILSGRVNELQVELERRSVEVEIRNTQQKVADLEKAAANADSINAAMFDEYTFAVEDLENLYKIKSQLDQVSSVSDIDVAQTRKLRTTLSVKQVGDQVRKIANNYRRQVSSLEKQVISEKKKRQRDILGLASLKNRQEQQLEKVDARARREAGSEMSNLIYNTQRQMESMISNASLSDAAKARLLKRLPKTRTPAQFNRKLNELFSEIDKEMEKQARKDLAKSIKQTLKKTVARGRKRKFGKFNADLQQSLDIMNQVTDKKHSARIVQAVNANLDAAIASGDFSFLNDPVQFQTTMAAALVHKEVSDRVHDYNLDLITQARNSHQMLSYPTTQVEALVKMSNATAGIPSMSSARLQDVDSHVRGLYVAGQQIAANVAQQRETERRLLIERTARHLPAYDPTKAGTQKLERQKNKNIKYFTRILHQNLAHGEKLSSFNVILDALNVRGEQGVLKKTFSVFKELNTMRENAIKQNRILADMVEVALANTGSTMKWQQKITQDNLDELNLSFTNQDGIPNTRLTMTRSQGMHLWGLFQSAKENANVAQLLKQTGFSAINKRGDQSLEAQLDRMLTAEDKAVVDAYFEFNDLYHDRVNEFSRAHLNTNIPKVPKYITYQTSKSYHNAVSDGAGMIYGTPSLVPSAVISRVPSDATLKLSDIHTRQIAHIKEVERGHAMYDKVQQISSVFNSPEIRNNLKDNFDEDFSVYLQQFINRFATGSADLLELPNVMAETARKWYSVYAIGGKIIKQILTQATSGHILLNEIPIMQRPAAIARTLDADRLTAAWQDLFSNATISERWFNNDPSLAVVSDPYQIGFAGKQMSLTDVLLFGSRAGDRVTAATFGAVAYTHYRDQGMSKEDAVLRVAEMIEDTQGSSAIDKLPVYGSQNSFEKFFALLANQPMQMYSMSVNRLRQFTRLENKTLADYKRLGRDLGDYWFGAAFFYMLTQEAMALFPVPGDDEEEYVNRLTRVVTDSAVTSALGSAPAIPVTGQILSAAWMWGLAKFWGDDFRPRGTGVDQVFSAPLVAMLEGISDSLADPERLMSTAWEDNVKKLGDFVRGGGALMGGAPRYFGELMQIPDMMARFDDPIIAPAIFAGWTSNQVKKRYESTPKLSDRVTNLIGGFRVPWAPKDKDGLDLELDYTPFDMDRFQREANNAIMELDQASEESQE